MHSWQAEDDFIERKQRVIFFFYSHMPLRCFLAENEKYFTAGEPLLRIQWVACPCLKHQYWVSDL